MFFFFFFFFFKQKTAYEILVRSRGLGDVYKRQGNLLYYAGVSLPVCESCQVFVVVVFWDGVPLVIVCLLYTSDAADERSSVDLGGRRIIKKKK